jgi:magnesium transporter
VTYESPASVEPNQSKRPSAEQPKRAFHSPLTRTVTQDADSKQAKLVKAKSFRLESLYEFNGENNRLLGHHFETPVDFGALADALGSPKTFHDSTQKRISFYSKRTGAVMASNLESLSVGEDKETIEKLVREEFFWLSFTSPIQSEVDLLSKILGIHPVTCEDINICSEQSREKCEVFSNYYFISFQSYVSDESSDNYLSPIYLKLVVFPNCIVTFQNVASGHFKNVLTRITKLSPFGITITSDWVHYGIIDDVVDSFHRPFAHVAVQIEQLESLELTDNKKVYFEMLKKISKCRKHLNALFGLLNTKDDMINMILKRKFNEAGETKIYLQDLFESVKSLQQKLNVFEKSLGRAHSNCLALISIGLTSSSIKNGEIASRITTLASIVVPLNIVTGLWGMNIKVPGQDDDNYLWFMSLTLSMGGFVLISIILARLFKLL